MITEALIQVAGLQGALWMTPSQIPYREPDHQAVMLARNEEIECKATLAAAVAVIEEHEMAIVDKHDGDPSVCCFIVGTWEGTSIWRRC
jgi:hypothetical protein